MEQFAGCPHFSAAIHSGRVGCHILSFQGLYSLFGYILGIPAMYSLVPNGSKGMAIQAAICWCLLGLTGWVIYNDREEEYEQARLG